MHSRKSGPGNKLFTDILVVSNIFLQIKQFLLDALDRMSFDPDDQTATMSYSFRNPHVLSLDMEQNMFLCAYKESPKSFTVRAESCNLEFNGNSTSAGIVHMNGATYKIMSERY